MSSTSRFLTRRRIALIAFGVAGLLAVFFAVRLILHGIYWNDPAHRDQDIADWMTPAYVGHAWNVPRPVISDAIGLTRDLRGKRLPLEDISDELGIPFEDLKQRLEDAIAAYRNDS
jgi:hypothetical protein